MPLEIVHSFASAKGDGPDTTLVQPSDWNALHVATLGPGLAGNPTGASGPLLEIPLGAGLTFEDGALVNMVKGIPIGAVIPFAGDFAPPYWLFCFGQEVDRIVFATLYSVIKILYGAGNGTTTFNVPDLRGRAVAGRDNMGGINANRILTTVDGKVLGNSVGTEKHILTANQLAVHTHTVEEGGAHSHKMVDPVDRASGSPSVGATEAISVGNTENLTYRLDGRAIEATVGQTSTAGSHTHVTAGAGADEAHLNMQPSIILNYIIWAGASETLP